MARFFGISSFLEQPSLTEDGPETFVSPCHLRSPRAKENVVAMGPASGSHSPPQHFRNQQALLKNLINEWASTTSMTKIGHSILW
ncbi:hypothetical protein FH972_001889 [Carpinus fangiana]|uniref:Uncharacterized protein n=1 Tax=Carpinus fangiana TaxID=176857 RepID=A0A5N6QFK0_9ROSI|nr:hypothetical protein FH972_001889 [Carpinus fangiana]